MTGAWNELVAAALVGTDRRPPELAAGTLGPAGGALGEAVAALGARPGPLDAAAVVWAYQEAGRLPPVETEPLPVPAATDERLLPPPGAVAALRSILEHSAYLPLLGEWFGLAAGARCRMPPELVPTVFETVPPALRPSAAALAGPLGAWLAGRNPDWAWAASPGPVEGIGAPAGAGAGATDLGHRWQEGSDRARLAALAALRQADVDQARRLVAASWAQEPPAMRLGILETVGPTLGPADEAVLEAALDDRRKDIRRLAVALLSRLPGSARAGRMGARALPCVRIAGRLRPRLELAYPDHVDAPMARDGIGPPPTGWGERHWWLRQLVAGTPLPAWVPALGRTPRQLVALARAAGDTSTALLAGWADAAVSQADAEWARALLAAGMSGPLLAVLPLAESEAAIVTHLADRGLAPSLPLLAGRPKPWPGELSAAVLDALVAAVATADLAGALAMRESLATLADSLDPSMAEPAVAALSAALAAIPAEKAQANRAFWERSVSALLATLNFRRALHAEFH